MATQHTGTPSPTSHHPQLDIGLIYQAYSLESTKETDKFRNLYELGACGANLEKVILEFGAEDTFFTFSLPANVQLAREGTHRLKSLKPSSTGTRNVYPGAKFGVIARPPGNQPPVLVFGICDCPTCKQSAADMDPVQLKPISGALLLDFEKSYFGINELTFRPICKEEYNLGSPFSTNLHNVLYYSESWSLSLHNFIELLRCNRVQEADWVAARVTATIRMNSVAEYYADTFDDNRNSLGLMLGDEEFSDFTLISNDDGGCTQFNCHKIILSVQSEELKRIILRKQAKEEPPKTRNKLTLTEGRMTVHAFLQWIYFKRESLISSSFDVASGLLRLAHEFNLPKLVAAAAQVLIKKVMSADPGWITPTALWNLYKFVRLVDKIDVAVRLKIAIVKNLAKTMAKKKVEKGHAGARNELKELNGGEPVDPLAANDFIMDLVELGKFDE